MGDKNIVIVDETTIYEVDSACVEEMRKKKEAGTPTAQRIPAPQDAEQVF